MDAKPGPGAMTVPLNNPSRRCTSREAPVTSIESTNHSIGTSMKKITVFRARKVVTMDPGRPHAEAIAVMDGRVVSTGTLASMQPWLTRYDHRIDDTLADKVILPGLIDPHTHFSMSSGFMALHYVGPIESPGPTGMNPALHSHEAVVSKLRQAHQSEADPKKPMIAWGLDPALQGGHLHRD